MISVEKKHFRECTNVLNFLSVFNQRAMNILLHMAADEMHEQNLFHILEAPQILYIGMTIKITNSVHMKHI